MSNTNETSKKNSNFVGLHNGHRQRMYQKISQGGLCDHELLETLLFFAIPRRNTNDIAHRLIRKFRSLSGVLNATADELSEVEGMGDSSAAFVQCIGEIIKNCNTTLKREIPSHYVSDEFIAFVKNTYADISHEVLDVYFLQDDTYIYLRRRFIGDCSSVTLQIKWLQKLIFDCEPTGIVLVHNHPSGCAEPSTEDRIALEQCQQLCLNMNVLFCEFLVCADEGVYSFYKTGEIARVAKALIAHSARKQPIVQKEKEFE